MFPRIFPIINPIRYKINNSRNIIKNNLPFEHPKAFNTP